MKFISKTLGCLFRVILIIVCIAVISAWLQSQGMSWMDLGKYILTKGGEFLTKVGQVILSMDWRFK
jgi:hypothetical protein